MHSRTSKRIIWLKPTKGYVSIGRQVIAKVLKKYGYDVEIIECSGLRLFKMLPKLLLHDYDAVVGTTHLGLAVGGFLKIVKQKPFIADFVDEYNMLYSSSQTLAPIIKFIISMEKISLKIADAVVVTPYREYEEIKQFRNNVFKVNLCTDLSKFSNIDSSTIYRGIYILKKLKIKFDKPIIVYLGSFNRVYNLELLVRAMEFLSNYQLILIGGGEEEQKLKKLTEELKLNNVFFLGYQPHNIVPGLLSLCDIGITLAEVPRQLKIYEYLAAGLSVVVPKSIFSSTDFDFEEVCIGVELSVESIAEGIRKALKESKSRLHPTKKLKKYDCEEVAKIYASVLERVL